MKECNLIAIDLAKNVFQICLLKDGKVLKNESVSRKKLKAFMVQQSQSIIAMEACYSSHYWGRTFQEMGHKVKLIPAQHVKPFVRGNKNDANDAVAIAEASQRPKLSFVPVKTLEQQDVQSLHRIRERLVKNRIQMSNQTRGLLSEYGIVFGQGHAALTAKLLELTEVDNNQLTPFFKAEIAEVFLEYKGACVRIDRVNKRIQAIAKSCARCQLLLTIPGIGFQTATALVSAIGNGSQFKNPREFAVWLGLTPRQVSSGSKSMLLGITKRGDRYLRTQFIHGGRAAIRWSKRRDNKLSTWVKALIKRRGINKATVALAHRLARIAWTLLNRNEPFNYQRIA